MIPKNLDILPPRPVLFPWIPEDFLDLGLNCCWGGGGGIVEDGTSRDSTTTTAIPTIHKTFSFDSEDYYDAAAFSGETKQQQNPLTPSTHPMSPSELSSDSSKSNSNTVERRRRSFLKPLFGYQKDASHGTTTILVLQNDPGTDDIPDMSPNCDDTLSESGNSYQSGEDDDDVDEKSFFGTTKKAKKARLVTFADVIAEVLRAMMFILSATGRSQKALLFQKNRQSRKVASH